MAGSLRKTIRIRYRTQDVCVARGYIPRLDRTLRPVVGGPGHGLDETAFGDAHRTRLLDGNRHPHYGRFLALVPDERVETTWVTGEPGTRGAETVVTVELEATGDGTMLILSHAGFADAETCKGHAEAWPEGLAHLDRCLADES